MPIEPLPMLEKREALRFARSILSALGKTRQVLVFESRTIAVYPGARRGLWMAAPEPCHYHIARTHTTTLAWRAKAWPMVLLIDDRALDADERSWLDDQRVEANHPSVPRRSRTNAYEPVGLAKSVFQRVSVPTPTRKARILESTNPYLWGNTTKARFLSTPTITGESYRRSFKTHAIHHPYFVAEIGHRLGGWPADAAVRQDLLARLPSQKATDLVGLGTPEAAATNGAISAHRLLEVQRLLEEACLDRELWDAA